MVFLRFLATFFAQKRAFLQWYNMFNLLIHFMIKFITTTRPLSRCIVWPLAPLRAPLRVPCLPLYAFMRPLAGRALAGHVLAACTRRGVRPLSWPRRLPYAAFIHAPRRPCVRLSDYPRGDMANQFSPPVSPPTTFKKILTSSPNGDIMCMR